MSPTPSARWLLVRRVLDRVVALIIAVVTAPVVAAIAWVIRREDGGPPLIRVPRAGQDGRPFGMWKLRSMRADGAGGLAAGATLTNGTDDDRITDIGKKIRSFHLDELPQLWNVAAGEMSLLGPRPETPDFVDRNDPRWQAVLAFPPGIAGPTQLIVSDWEREVISASKDGSGYRNAVLPTKLAIDRWYLDTASPATDLLVAGTLLRRFLPGTEAWTLRRRVFKEVPEAAPARAFLRGHQLAAQLRRRVSSDAAAAADAAAPAGPARRITHRVTATVAHALDARVARSGSPGVDELSMRPVPHAWVWSTDIEGEVVLYDAAHELAHHLSPEAAQVWQRCDGGRSIADIAHDLAATSKVDAEHMVRDVVTVVLQLEAVGALVDSATAAADPTPPDPEGRRLYAVEGAGPVVSFDLEHLRQHHFSVTDQVPEVFGYRFRVFTDAAELRRSLNDVFDSVAAATSDAGTGAIWDYFVVPMDGGATVQLYREGVHLRTCSAAEAPELLLWYVTQHAVAAASDVVLHAAAVAHDGTVVLLPAPDGAGKSTLTAALVRYGFGYVSDDAVGLDPASLQAHPFAHALAPGPSQPAAEHEPAAPSERLTPPSYVRPRDVRPGSITAGGAVGFVVAPAYRPGGDILVEALTPAQILVRLLSAAMNLDVVGRGGFDALVELSRAVVGYRLEYGDADAARPVIERMLADGARQQPHTG